MLEQVLEHHVNPEPLKEKTPPKDPQLPEKEAQETEVEEPREPSALERFRRRRR